MRFLAFLRVVESKYVFELQALLFFRTNPLVSTFQR
nr:MAG TPA: hypothetical protein [Caudoviricetes sp.]